MQELLVDIYPLPGIELQGTYRIKDHINLSGRSPSHIGFVPIGDLYLAKNDPDAIIVVGIPPATSISEEEAAKLRAVGVKAYSYSLIESALYAAANGQQVDAIGVVPQIPSGFELFSAKTGLKASGNKDIGIIYSRSSALWAGCFTTNSARAACVDNNISQLGSKIQALICNSGNANACTGEQGNQDDLELRRLVATKFKLNDGEVLTASTGKIGVPLDMEVLGQTISSIKNSDEDVLGFAQSILTTDLVVKVSSSADNSMLGITKGSGMIAPNMATMLAFIISDLKIEGMDLSQMQRAFQQALSEITARTFNRISVDGDTSTNDMVIFMSNCSGKAVSIEEFKASLEAVCKDLALKIIQDGEGVTKIMELSINDYEDESQAQIIGNSIINSPLVKTALHGCDPNWGRIIAAAGKNQKIDLNKVTLSFWDTEVFKNGSPTEFDKGELSDRMKRNKFIPVFLNLGSSQNQSVIEFWATDLSYDYVRINAEYST